MAYTPIPVILDRMLSDSIKYEDQQAAKFLPMANSKTHAECLRHQVQAGFLLVARMRLRKQYGLIK